MLTRLHRFHGHGSLRRSLTHSKTARSPLMSLRFNARPQNKSYRVAVVVSRKVHKSAVVRNRIRRRVYEAVRRSNNVPPCTDLVFIVHNDQLATIESERLETAVNELLKKTNSQHRTNP
jgi:ribonuclease P protein component